VKRLKGARAVAQNTPALAFGLIVPAGLEGGQGTAHRLGWIGSRICHACAPIEKGTAGGGIRRPPCAFLEDRVRRIDHAEQRHRRTADRFDGHQIGR
jgi:hypothetical protein